MPAEPSGRFFSERALAVINAIILVLALLFIVTELLIRFGAGRAALEHRHQPAITLSNSLSAVPVEKAPDGTEIVNVTCNVVAKSQSPHPVCITYARPSTSATAAGR
jgi:hypothetical protein